MEYDPTRPRETAASTSNSGAQRRAPSVGAYNVQYRNYGQRPIRTRKYALQIGEPTEENTYGTGLGYDPKDPRNTARGSQWVKDHTGKFGLTQKGANALYRQNPNYNMPMAI